MKIGNSEFTKDMPVLYFDSLKTSTVEGAATTVYATGGRGNSRLIAWEGEKTLTFTMEDALISPVGLAILAGAGLMTYTDDAKNLSRPKPTAGAAAPGQYAILHGTETVEVLGYKAGTPAGEDGEPAAVPSGVYVQLTNVPLIGKEFYAYAIPLDVNGDFNGQPVRITTINQVAKNTTSLNISTDTGFALDIGAALDSANITPKVGDLFMIDYYYESTEKQEVQQIEIDAENFAGNFYLEASTLFRTRTGKDLPAEFIIPNCDIQSNFTFTMASTGDPSELMRLAA